MGRLKTKTNDKNTDENKQKHITSLVTCPTPLCYVQSQKLEIVLSITPLPEKAALSAERGDRIEVVPGIDNDDGRAINQRDAKSWQSVIV